MIIAAPPRTVVFLDDYRPRTLELLRCLFCWRQHTARIRCDQMMSYHPCPGCDEIVSVPQWRLQL
jgi:hypothetical protein